MLVGKGSMVLLGAGLLLVGEPEAGLLPTLSVSSAAQPGLRTGQVFRDRLKNGTDAPEMIVIPAGRFRMGDIQGKGTKDEQPVHEVHISRRFGMSRYEITFDQYDEFAKATGHGLPEDEDFGRGRRPVIRVSWNEAGDYAAWLSQQTGKRYRLPTEAEWEYAARAGTETVYWWGNEMKRGLANCIGCGSRWDRKGTGPVGSFKPNPFGLYDTAGNVTEWVQDCWHDNYQGAPSDGSAWEKEHNGDCDGRVRRGGNYIGDARSSSRGLFRAGARYRALGFRLVREIE
jgi:formylglycine-generating enzyme required for sulfatase activity